MPDVPVLNVRLLDRAVGTLTFLPGERTLFVFDDSYLADPHRPTLSLSFKDSFGEIIAEQSSTRVRVPAFFANLLPEGHLRTYLAARAGVKEIREFFLLWILGQDLPGGVVIEPAEGQPSLPSRVRRDEGDGGQTGGRRQILRFSLAGVQLKFSAVLEASGGLTIPASGVGGSWIIKLPSAHFAGVPENEFAMMSLAARIGIDVPTVRQIDLGDISGLPEGIGRISGRALAVKRFDRMTGGGRIHMEDFAQVFALYPNDKYKRGNYRNIAEVIWAEIGEAGITEFVKRLVFNALIGNADMHMKNWSLVYPEGRSASLAPAYDLVSTIPYLPDEHMALKLTRSRRFADLTKAAIAHFAAKAALPERMVLSVVRETVERFHEQWTTAKLELPIAAEVASAIDSHLADLPLAKGR